MDISFSLGGMQFEYGEEKIKRISGSMGSPSEALLVFSSTMTESNYSMKRTALMKNVMIPSGTHLQG